jgi:hypothetical protein
VALCGGIHIYFFCVCNKKIKITAIYYMRRSSSPPRRRHSRAAPSGFMAYYTENYTSLACEYSNVHKCSGNVTQISKFAAKRYSEMGATEKAQYCTNNLYFFRPDVTKKDTFPVSKRDHTVAKGGQNSIVSEEENVAAASKEGESVSKECKNARHEEKSAVRKVEKSACMEEESDAKMYGKEESVNKKVKKAVARGEEKLVSEGAATEGGEGSISRKKESVTNEENEAQLAEGEHVNVASEGTKLVHIDDNTSDLESFSFI